jgi:hypothetical protein
MCSRPSDAAGIRRLVDELSGGGPLVIREYVHFFGDDIAPETVTALGAEGDLDHLTMPDEWYVENGRALDLVASYLPRTADIAGWLTFLDTLIERYGHLTRYLQVTLEPNFPIPLIDGSSPGVLDALTLGIPHARAALNRNGLSDVLVGFSVAEPPEWLGGDDAFWLHLAMTPARDFAVDVDYVGLALYPDAFSPVAPRGTPGDVASLTAHALRHLRDDCLPRAHIPASVPLHIVENGSPSGAPRTENDQAESQSDMIHTILEHRVSANVTQYELFSLRDADSSSPEPLGSLGLVTDTYERKAAFDMYREMIHRTGRPMFGDGLIDAFRPTQ